MEQIKVVIGANFGDEGKGQMTEYFSFQAKQKGKSCLVVCHNGTAQRGHTCILENVSRHIYHHLGAGTAVSADTYFSKDFVVNPMFFRKEYEQVRSHGYLPKVYVNENCRIAIPFDLMINQEIETLRGSQRHGSCGYGFFESIQRNNQDRFKTIVKDSYHLREFYDRLKQIQEEYGGMRLHELGFSVCEQDQDSLFWDEEIIKSYMDDLKFFLSHTTLMKDSILLSYDHIIFEGAQGLLLDMDNEEYFPHLTPSKTGFANSFKIINALAVDCPVEVCYVTRTYLTRHGAGRLDGECKKEEINPTIMDLTNVPNEFQESLRYAMLNVKDLKNRIQADFLVAENDSRYSCEIAVMHENEYYVEELASETYHSDGMTKADIYIINR